MTREEYLEKIIKVNFYNNFICDSSIVEQLIGDIKEALIEDLKGFDDLSSVETSKEVLDIVKKHMWEWLGMDEDGKPLDDTDYWIN